MSVLWQQIRTDLIDRRLLPIPVALVIGVIAVPILAQHHRSSAEALPFATPKTAAALPTTTPTATPTPQSASTANPFPAASTASSKSTATTTPATTKSATTAPATTKTPATTTAPTTTTPAPTAPAANLMPTVGPSFPRRFVITAVDLRFGPAVVPHIRRDVARLTPLPSSQAPVALLLGRLPGARSVAFQISPGVIVAGDGTCVPRKTICRQLVLRPGDRALLTRPSGRRLRLALVRVRTSHTKSATRAQHSYDRVSPAGQCILDTVGAYRYDAKTGLLHRTGIVAKGCHYADADTSGSLRGTR